MFPKNSYLMQGHEFKISLDIVRFLDSSNLNTQVLSTALQRTRDGSKEVGICTLTGQSIGDICLTCL